MHRIGQQQPYRGWLIVRTHAGYAVQRPGGAHACTLATYGECIAYIDAWAGLAADMFSRLAGA